MSANSLLDVTMVKKIVAVRITNNLFVLQKKKDTIENKLTNTKIQNLDGGHTYIKKSLES